LLDQIIKESGKKILFFDEIQIVKGWELFVRQKLDQSVRVIITGSNARMLSVELGTNLTGRHISKELFPFNYKEFCSFYAMQYNKESLISFLNKGGFPEFLKTNNNELLSFLIEDIIYKINDDFFAIQVCYEINGDNQEREINGLLAALKFFNLRERVILTIDQTDTILLDGYKINVMPAYQFNMS
jgi:predicted AAA+ superfamily ATPase